jgi:hypothetical protein
VQSAPLPSLKNVHFAEEKDKLESVCVFRRSARPASLCSPHEDTETEAEDENGISPDSFPLTNTRFTRTTFYLDHTTSPIPSLFSSPDANIYFESIALSSPDSMPVLTGFVVVRNIAYEKRVAARFTMDSWQTTSEVVMRHVVSLPSIPPAIIIGCAGRDRRRDGWDRFTFTIRLEDHVFTLQEKVMWLVVMYSTASGEWWDNNEGHNYRVGFQAGSQSARRRAVSLSAPGMFSWVLL